MELADAPANPPLRCGTTTLVVGGIVLVGDGKELVLEVLGPFDDVVVGPDLISLTSPCSSLLA